MGPARLPTDLFKVVVDASPSAMIVVDPGGRIVLVNQAIERLFGYRREELLGQPVELLMPGGIRHAHEAHRQQYFSAPEPRMMGQGRDLYGQSKSGEEIPIEVGLTPIEMPGGTHVLGAIVDLTYRRQAQEELAKQAEELKRSNTELEQFAYVASHDLQEPLRMVKSYIELMEKRLATQLDDKTRKYMRYIVEGVERTQSLVNDLLGYSRVGRRELDRVELDTNRVVSHVVTLLGSAMADQPGAQVTWDRLPTVLATESMMVQLFQNLIANGLKFRGDESPRVHISCERRGEEWCFSVADNGIGIDRKYADRIFLVFQRLHERHRYQGTGIGLAVAKRIVERHGGRIWFESEPGHGTTFFFTLPVLPPSITGKR